MTEYVRVVIDHPGYVVPADNKEAIEYAKECLYDDMMGMCAPGVESSSYISTVPAPEADEDDVPDFIGEFIDDFTGED